MYIQWKMVSLRQTLIPLFKEDWPDGTVLTPEEETYQEYWGEYEGWWYAVPFEHDVDDAPVVFRYEEIMGMVMQLVDEDANSEPANNSVQIPDGGFQVDVCKSCHCIVVNGRHVGTWDSEIPEHQPPFKCMFCGPPLPAGKQCADPVMFYRWNDFERVRLGEPGGVLTIVHATYGGPTCPERDVTDKMCRIIQFQRRNMGRQGYIDADLGIHRWIGDPEVDTAKTLRVWFTMRTREERERDERERWALGQLQRFSNRWREMYYAPGGIFEARAAQRFERLCQ